jgi:hypothetical protein
VNKAFRKVLWSVSALALLLVPLTQAGIRSAVAAEPQPIAVVALNGADQLMKEISFLTEAAGARDIGSLLTLMAGPYTAALEKGKPAGLYVLQKGEMDFAAVAFVPVKDVNILLAAFEQQIGKPKELGEGVLEVAGDQSQPMYVKQQGNWAFLTDKKAELSALPSDPAKLLGGLDRQYTLAARANLSKLPNDWRKMAVEQMRKGFQEGLERMQGDERKLAEQFGEGFVTSLVQVVEGLEEVTLGWKIDSERKTTFLEVGLTALPGSELAKQMALVRQAKSAFAGFLLPDAALTLHAVGASSAQEVKQAQAMLNAARDAAMKGIDQDGNLAGDDERQRVKKIVNQLLDVADATVKLGQTDAGAVLLLKPDALNFAAGGLVADGKKLAQILKELAKFAKEKDANFPDIRFDASTYQGVTFHTAAIPLKTPPDEAKQLLGESLQVVVGTGAKSLYVSLGKDPEALLKKVIDTSAEKKNTELPPAQLTIAVTPILETVAALQDNAQVKDMLDTLKGSGGKDKILIRAMPIERGGSFRMEMEAGVLRVLGDVVRMVAPLVQSRFGQ